MMASMTTPEGDTVATTLHALQRSLPPSERRVARTVLDGYPMAGIGTLAEVAGRARVSGPTVLRLLNRLGYGTFGEFQRALLAEVEERLATAAGAIGASAAAPAADGHPVTRLLGEVAANIAADAQSLVGGEVDEAIAVLAERSRNVATVGGWQTWVLAEYAALQLQLMRPRCRSLGPSVSLSTRELIDLGRRDVLVAFDTRPYTTTTTEQLCAHARRRGVRVILFTDPWLSPIARHASHVLVARTASSSPFDSYASLFALLEAVLAAVAARLGEPARRRIDQGERLLEGWSWAPEEPGA